MSLFKKKVPTNTTWEFDKARQRRKEIFEVLAVVTMIPVFYYLAVLLLCL